VRKEKFGLLFYNSADTNLTFIKSGDLLGIDTDAEGKVKITITHHEDDPGQKIKNVLKTLINKGLIIEAPSGIQ
jgi:putative mycofactocin binding protein MftB